MKAVPDPESFGVVVYGDDGHVVDIVEKAGTVDLRYDAPEHEHDRQYEERQMPDDVRRDQLLQRNEHGKMRHRGNDERCRLC